MYNANILAMEYLKRHYSNDILDKEGIELLFKKAQEEGLVLKGEDRTNISSISRITMFKDRKVAQ